MEHLQNLMETMLAYRRHNGGHSPNIVNVSPAAFEGLIQEIKSVSGASCPVLSTSAKGYLCIWRILVKRAKGVKDADQMYALKISEGLLNRIKK